MRRSMIAVSALALVTTLSACAGQPESTADNKPPAPENDAPAQESAPEPISDFATLVKTVDGAAKEQKTVSVRFKYEGDPSSAYLNSVSCQANVVESKYSCSGPVEAVGSLDSTIFFKHPTPADPAKPWSDVTQAPQDVALEQAMGSVISVQGNTHFDQVLSPGTTIINSTPDELDGEQTVRYELVTDLNATANDPATSDKEKANYRKLIEAGATELHKTLWLNADNLPVQWSSAVPAMAIDGKQNPAVNQTTLYSDWGKPVDIKVPSPDQVSTPGQ